MSVWHSRRPQSLRFQTVTVDCYQMLSCSAAGAKVTQQHMVVDVVWRVCCGDKSDIQCEGFTVELPSMDEQKAVLA